MTADELRAAIVEPARRAGARVDEDLVKVLLGDLASRSVTAAHDPGGLPLLSHALLATWERSNRRRLTVSDYYATGGIAGAIEQAAETTYGRLDPAEQACVPGLFLRLINLDGETVSRRRVPLSEVVDDPQDDAMAAVVDAFCDARLLTRQMDSVEITHEALITAWPRLDNWISSNRAGLLIHRRVTVAARLWDASGRDDDHLVPAARLATLREWTRLEAPSIQLNRLENEFLQASESFHRRAAEQHERQQRSRRRLGTIALLLAVLCALLAVATTGAYLNARRYRAEAETARDEARSRQVALEATKLRTKDPALSSQLALAAYRISPTLEARSALLDATAVWTPTRLTGDPGPMQVRASPDDSILATADAGGRVRLFSLTGPNPVAVAAFAAAPAEQPDLYALAWSGDGKLLAVGGQAAPSIWDVSDPAAPQHLRTLALDVTTYTLAFAEGTLLAGTSDGRVVGWSDPLRSAPRVVVDGIAEGVAAIAVSSDGRRLAVAGAADRVEVWRLDGTRATGRRLGALPGGRALSVAFSPDDSELAAGTTGAEVRRWELTARRLVPAPTLTGFGSYVNALAYQADAYRLVAGSSDQTTSVYDLSSVRRLSTMPGPAIVVSLQVVGDRIVTASTDGTTRLWPLPAPTIRHALGSGWQLGVSTDQRILAEATGRGDGAIRLYELDLTGQPGRGQAVMPPDEHGIISGAGALSADGTLLAGGTTTGQIVLWGIADGRTTRLSTVSHLGAGRTGSPASQLQAVTISPDNHRLASIDATRAYTVLWDITNPSAPRRQPMRLPAGAIPLAAAFSPDSTLLVVGDAKDEARLWDVVDPARPRPLAVLGSFEDDVNAVAFAPTGGLLAVGSADRTIRLWDVSEPAHPRQVAQLVSAEGAVNSVAFSSDASRLAAGSADGSVWLYDLTSAAEPRILAILGAADERVYDARFVDDDAQLVGTGPSGALRFWQIDTQVAIDEICARRGDPIDADEWNRYLTGIPIRPICP
jgi:WD40 repeat protein